MWPHPQIKEFALSPSFRLTLCMYGSHFEDSAFIETADKFKKTKSQDRDFTALIAKELASTPQLPKLLSEAKATFLSGRWFSCI